MTSSLTLLDWDSGFFGRSVGNLYLSSLSQLEEELDRASGKGFDLIYVYLKEEIDIDRIGNFRLIDVGARSTLLSH